MGYYDDKYFYYKGRYYTTKTVVKLTQQYRNTHTNLGFPIWKYAWFSHKIINRNEYCFYYANEYYSNVNHEQIRSGDYCGYFQIKAEDLENAIEEIIKPVLIELVLATPKKDCAVEGMGTLWIIYIAIMISSLIFNEFYIIWIIVTYLFFKLRNEILNNR